MSTRSFRSAHFGALAAVALVSCGPAARSPSDARPAQTRFKQLEQQSQPAPRDAGAALDGHAVATDLDLLTYALESGYAGRKFVGAPAWTEMSRRLEALRGKPTTVEAFCTAIGDALWQLPDAHLNAKRRSPADGASIRCGALLRQANRTPSVGKNYGADMNAKPWASDLLAVGHASFGVVSMKEMALADDPAWGSFSAVTKGMMTADGLVIDLRGNGGGDDTRGIALARLLIDGPIRSPYLRTHERRTAESLTLQMNVYGTLERGSGGGLTPHVQERYDRFVKDRDAASRGGQAEWKVLAADAQPTTPGPKAYGGKIAIIVDSGCASSCESTLEALREHPKAKVFGERTAGFIQFGETGMLALPNSGVSISIPAKYWEYPSGATYDKVGFEPDVAVSGGANAFDAAMAWMIAETPRAGVVKAAEYSVPEADRSAEANRLTRLGITVKDSGPVLERPWAAPLSRRSLVVPQDWLSRQSPRVVYAPALLADLDALELAMSRAYGGWDVAAKHGFEWKAWFERWRGQLTTAGARWLPLASAFAPVEELQRFQLDNHTTIPLGLRFGAGSHTTLLRQKPTGPCTRVKDKAGKEYAINISDPAQVTKAARRWDGKELTPAWYLAHPSHRRDLESAFCGGQWVATASPEALDKRGLTEGILGMSKQAKDLPFLRHLTPEVAYLRLPSFTKASAEVIERERSSWDNPTGKERALIVDLRGNEGGDAAFQTLAGWIALDELKDNLGFDKSTGASCLYPALRWGYSSISSFGLEPPLTDAMRTRMQSEFDALFTKDDPSCPAKFVVERAKKNFRDHARSQRPRARKPRLMLVVDEGCGSDCEFMVGTLAKLPETIIVGTNTYGVMQYIQPGYSVLPNTRLPFRFALGTSDSYGDNRSLDGYGFDVDVVIDGKEAWSEAGLLQLEQALRLRP